MLISKVYNTYITEVGTRRNKTQLLVHELTVKLFGLAIYQKITTKQLLEHNKTTDIKKIGYRTI